MRNLLHSRLPTLVLFFATFIVISLLVRTALLVKAWPELHAGVLDYLTIFGMGIVFDIATAVFFLLPYAFLLLAIPERWNHKRFMTGVRFLLLFSMIGILLFDSVAEYLFWDEFQARFDFIAVDYLVYTSEVVRNIWESYPMAAILSTIAGLTLLASWFLRKPLTKLAQIPSYMRYRNVLATLLVALAVMDFMMIDSSMAHASQNRYVNELSRNGIYSFFAAFRNNQLDYVQYYPTEDPELVSNTLQDLVPESQVDLKNGHLTRKIVSNQPEQRYNVMLVVVESLSAKFLGQFGSTLDLTPQLDKLAQESLLFTNLHATGTRTVRGLEAISLSVPPTPGNSIVKRPNNEGLYNISTEFKKRDYDTRFLYGGYGYFDNMNYFFGNNGFEIVDRSDLTDEEIHFTNAWGVSDEDIFARAIKEADKSTKNGKPFFNMIMTTSNHRPFTYPEGRIDIPSHSGRDGAIKYTDYAIGQLIEQAKKHSWFDNTIFVIVADHCASGAGEAELAVQNYHIPMLFYAPKILKPGKVDILASQIDLAPTLIGVLNFNYQSAFYGRDLLHEGHNINRVLLGNYQKLAYIHGDSVTILSPHHPVEQYHVDMKTGKYLGPVQQPEDAKATIAYYQQASYGFKHGGMRSSQ